MKKYFSLVKFSHTIFAMPFAILGFVIGIKKIPYTFSLISLLYVIICMITARNSAMTFNRIVDKEFDKKNLRTATRDLPKGNLSLKSVYIFLWINIGLFILTTFFINKLCFYLSPVVLIVILGYSFVKRFSSLSHFILGLGLSITPVGAFMVVTNTMDWKLLALSFGVLFWVTSFDIIYALQDEKFDKENSLFSIPVLLGAKKSLLFSRITQVCSLLCFAYFGYIFDMNIFFFIGFILFAFFNIYQHFLVKANNLDKVNYAFFTLNGIAGVLFCSFSILDLILELKYKNIVFS